MAYANANVDSPVIGSFEVYVKLFITKYFYCEKLFEVK